MGRTAYGVKGITLEEGDEVVSAEALPPVVEGVAAPTILTATANGYGKRSELAEYRTQSRGGKGIITIKATERNGPVVAAVPVTEGEEAMIITNRGMLIRLPVRQISVIGRNTQGVRLITVESREEQVVAVARVAETGAEAGEAGVADAPEEPAEGGAPPSAGPAAEGEDDDGGEPGGGGEP